MLMGYSLKVGSCGRTGSINLDMYAGYYVEGELRDVDMIITPRLLSD
jgi:hypothetical protein